MTNHPAIPEHLASECGDPRKWDICYGCGQAVKQGPDGRWFVTMGHPGFNSPANNRDGYATLARALAAVRAYGRFGSAGMLR